MTVRQAEELIAAGELGSGSMRPKVDAAVEFVSGGGGRAIIANLGQGMEALSGKTGTTIIGDTK